jgi:tetratricopeptide (TPR) repeat protein
LARTYKKNGIMEETVEAFQLAIDTYRGSFLAQDIYDEWTIPSRDGWKLDYENALIDLAILYNKLERFQAALVCCNQGLLQNSFNEALYQEKMKALFGLGQREEAYRVFEQCSGRLQQMDASPATETIRLRGSLHEHFGGFESGNRKTSKIQKALLKGRYLLSKSTVSAAKQAYGYFQQAAMLDPESPDAHAGLADTHAYLVIYHQCSVDNHCDAAKAEALQAMSLDETSPAAQTALALVLMNFEWDGVQAEVHLKLAIELDPGYLPAYLRMAAYKAAWGEYQAALSFAYQAHELDPLSIETYMAIARIFYLIKDTDSMIDSARQALELDPHSYRAHQFMGQAYGLRSEQALELHHFQQSAQLSGGVTSDLVSLGHAYGSAGKRADAERILTKMQSVSTKQFVSPYHLGVVLAGMKEYQLAVDQLEQARQQRSWPLVLAYTEPRLSKLRSTSAYKAWANN